MIRCRQGVRVWTLQISAPPEPGSTWRRTLNYSVCAATIQRAVEMAEKAVPGCVVFNASSRSERDGVLIDDECAETIE